MTAVEIGAFEEIVAHEDLMPPCECKWHNRDVATPVEWVVWFVSICCMPGGPRLWCNDCLVRVLEHEHTVRCSHCGEPGLPAPRELITYYERLAP